MGARTSAGHHSWWSNSMPISIGTVWVRLAGWLILNAAVGKKRGRWRTRAKTEHPRRIVTYVRQRRPTWAHRVPRHMRQAVNGAYAGTLNRKMAPSGAILIDSIRNQA